MSPMRIGTRGALAVYDAGLEYQMRRQLKHLLTEADKYTNNVLEKPSS